MTQSDKRIVRNPASAVRGQRSGADLERTETDGTALTMAERRAMIRNEFKQEALPRAPHLPGYHTCWLSTTNAYDPIQKRMRIGYTPVKQSEVQGMESFSVQSGEFVGFVACNEMLLFKIEHETYLAIMEEFHHNMPFEEEQQLKNTLMSPTGLDTEDRNGSALVKVDKGENQDIAAPGKVPSFAL